MSVGIFRMTNWAAILDYSKYLNQYCEAMMDKDITKKYSNEEITVVWKPKVCIHSENKPFCDGSHVKKEFKG